MTRIRALPPAGAIRMLVNEQRMLTVHVTANARHTELLLPTDIHAPILSIRTTATPEDGKANREVVQLVAKALGIAKGKVTLERGATSRTKLLKIAD